MIRRLLTILALTLPLTAYSVCSDCAGSAGYVPVTVEADQVDEVVPYFVIYLSDMPADFHTAMDDITDVTGRSIRVTKDDGTTECAIYILDIDTSTNQGIVFVQAVDLSATVDTVYRVYIGNDAAGLYLKTDTYGQYNVFPADIACFYPLCGPDPLYNSAQDNYHLTVNGSPTSGNAGPFEGTESYAFSGTSQYLYNNSTPASTWPVDISGWFYANNITSSHTVAGLGDTASANNYISLEAAGATTGDPVRVRAYGDAGSERIAASTTGYSATTWTFGAGSRDSDAGSTFALINGGSMGENTASINAGSFTNIGVAVVRRSSLTSFFNGNLSLVTISTASRSTNYTKTMYNVFASSTFYTAGTWTPLGGGGADTTNGFFILGN